MSDTVTVEVADDVYTVTTADDVIEVAVASTDTVVATIPIGAAGPPGLPGAPGGSILSGWWKYATQTSGPAAAGQIRTNVVGDSGTIWISTTDDDGLDWSAVTAAIGDQVVLRSATGETWTLTIDDVVQPGEWAVTLDSSTAEPPRKNIRVQVSLVRAGGHTHTQHPTLVYATERPTNPEPGTIWVPTT